MSTTGQRTESFGERKLSWRQETPAKLSRAEFELKKITTISITNSHRKIEHVRFYQHSKQVPEK